MVIFCFILFPFYFTSLSLTSFCWLQTWTVFFVFRIIDCLLCILLILYMLMAIVKLDDLQTKCITVSSRGICRSHVTCIQLYICARQMLQAYCAKWVNIVEVYTLLWKTSPWHFLALGETFENTLLYEGSALLPPNEN